MQYTLPLQKSREYRAEDYIFSTCNAELQDLLSNKQWGHDPYPEIVLLIGPRSSGKTHFIHLLPESILVMDNIDDMNETEVLHVFNRCHENHQYAFFTCKDYKQFKLPDLLSRLASVRSVTIDWPDDLMMRSLLIKLLTERSIKVSDDVVKFLLMRIARSFAALEATVDMIDKLSIQQKRNISIPFLSKLKL